LFTDHLCILSRSLLFLTDCISFCLVLFGFGLTHFVSDFCYVHFAATLKKREKSGRERKSDRKSVETTQRESQSQENRLLWKPLFFFNKSLFSKWVTLTRPSPNFPKAATREKFINAMSQKGVLRDKSRDKDKGGELRSRADI